MLSNRDGAGLAGIPEIEGIDIADGLRRVAGNRRLYRSLLEQFAVETRRCRRRGSTGAEKRRSANALNGWRTLSKVSQETSG